MNEIENTLHALLSESGDIGQKLLQICHALNREEKVYINSGLQEELCTRLSGHEYEEEAWNELLAILLPNELSENVFNYLFRSKISLIMLCHMPLRSELLKQLIRFDDAPLFLLAQRYYTNETSAEDFTSFYYQYLHDRDDVSLYLLDICGRTDKRALLIRLCHEKATFLDQEKLNWHQVADSVREMTNSQEIVELYRKYQNIGIVLVEISANCSTPSELLSELSVVKGIPHAREIRNNSMHALKSKGNITG